MTAARADRRPRQRRHQRPAEATGNGADVITMSLGAIQGVQALVLTGVITDVQDAVTYAVGKGVAATDKREGSSAYSSGTIKPDLMAVSAPGGSLLPICGEDIVSTVPAGTGRSATCRYADYDEFAGTSMATPHVAGVAALLAAQGRTVANIYDTMMSTARTPGGLARGVSRGKKR